MQRLPDLPVHAQLLPGDWLLRPQRRVDGLQHSEDEDHHPNLSMRSIQVEPGKNKNVSKLPGCLKEKHCRLVLAMLPEAPNIEAGKFRENRSVKRQ